MLTSRPIVAFVATTDPAGAKRFYANTLGLRLVAEDGFALVFDAGGTMLRIATVPALQPAGYTVLGWLVPDIERAVRDLQNKQVAFNRYDGMGQDELGIWTAPSGARIAWFADPDGNTLSLTEMDAAPRRRPPVRRPPRKAARRAVRKAVRKAPRKARGKTPRKR
jgi:catechol 2,3-dioxygenase-like lactoylglutathione lyase family enzyme